jgi:uncharacterized membrane protein YoaK (UPF0700 family)
VAALALAGVAGFVDVVGYITLHHLFTAHMSGNAARLGVALGHGHLSAALPFAVALAAFVTAIGAGTLAAELLGARSPALLALEMLPLTGFMVYGGAVVARGGHVAGRSPGGYYVLVALAILAMGFQTSALSRVGGQPVRTTYITGVVTRMTQTSVKWALGRRQPSPERDAGPRARLLGGIALAYLAGGTAGSLAQSGMHLWSLAIPLAALALVTIGFQRAGAAR